MKWIVLLPIIIGYIVWGVYAIADVRENRENAGYMSLYWVVLTVVMLVSANIGLIIYYWTR